MSQLARLSCRTVTVIALAGCASAPPPHETAAVAALQKREAACAKFIEMEALSQEEAVIRLRGMDQCRCGHLQVEAVRLMSDPAANPSSDPRTTRFLEALAYPQGRD